MVALLIAVLLAPLAADSLADALAAGRFQEALRAADAALAARPRDARLWTARGLALNGLRREKEGLASFDRALKIDHKFVPALQAAAETAYRARDKRASAYLDRLLRLEPSSEPAHAMAGVLAFEGRDCRRAAAHFEQARGAIERDETASSQQGRCLLELGRPGDAVAVFARVIELHPASVNARYNLAVAELGSRQPERAIATLEPLAADAEALNLLAAAQTAAGRIEPAIASLRRAAQLAPKDERHYLDLASLCVQHDSLDLAGEVVAVGLRHVPASARLYAMRGVIHAQRLDFERAAADFEQASRLEPDQAYGSVGLSVLLTQTGRLEGAVKLLRQKLTRAPNDATLNYLLADALLREGVAPPQPGFAEARRALERAIRARPDFAKARAALGKVHLREGDAARAAEQLELALQHDPENRTALNQLMVALRQLGREQDAAATAARLRRQFEEDLAADAIRQRVRLAAP